MHESPQDQPGVGERSITREKEIEHHHQYPDPERLMAEQQPMFDRIDSAGGFQQVWEEESKRRPNLKEAFLSRETGVCCMDERIASGSGIRLAGSGILMDRESLLNDLQASGATEVSSHQGCGAAKLALMNERRQSDPNAPEPTAAEVDAYAREWSASVADELERRSGRPVGFSHRTFRESGMEGDPGIHAARAAYYDGTGRLDLSKAKEVLPQGFVVSRSAIDGKDAASQIELAFAIATGDHGLGEQITKERPFHAVVVGRTKDEVDRLRAELDEAVQRSEGRLVIDDLVVPIEGD